MQESDYEQLKISKGVFILLMGIGYMMRPELLKPKENYGVSNFWFKKKSKAPYIAGFLFNAMGTLYVANKIHKRRAGDNKIAGGLAAKSAIALLVLFSSKLLGTKRSRLHYMAGGVMYAAQVLFSGWLIKEGKKNIKNITAFGIGIIGTGLVLLTAAQKTQQMFTGQVLAQFGYISLLLRNLRKQQTD